MRIGKKQLKIYSSILINKLMLVLLLLLKNWQFQSCGETMTHYNIPTPNEVKAWTTFPPGPNRVVRNIGAQACCLFVEN
jgi:hypothetical protein